MFRNDKKCGFAVWGTKLGESIFHIDNLENTHYQVRKVLKDIRSRLTVQGIDKSFYSYESHEQFRSWTLYRTIRDWAGYGKSMGRVGYFAMTIFVPRPFSLITEDLIFVLNELSKHYWDNYVIQESGVDLYRINRSVAEDFEEMYSMVARLSLNLDGRQRMIPRQEGKLFFCDEKGPSLDVLVDSIANNDYPNYKSIIIIPDKIQDSIICNYELAKKSNIPGHSAEDKEFSSALSKSRKDSISEMTKRLQSSPDPKTISGDNRKKEIGKLFNEQRSFERKKERNERKPDRGDVNRKHDQSQGEKKTDKKKEGKKEKKKKGNKLIKGGLLVILSLLVMTGAFSYIFMMQPIDYRAEQLIGAEKDLMDVRTEFDRIEKTADFVGYSSALETYDSLKQEIMSTLHPDDHQKFVGAINLTNKRLSKLNENLIVNHLNDAEYNYDKTKLLIESVVQNNPLYDIEEIPLDTSGFKSMIQKRIWSYHMATVWLARVHLADSSMVNSTQVKIPCLIIELMQARIKQFFGAENSEYKTIKKRFEDSNCGLPDLSPNNECLLRELEAFMADEYEDSDRLKYSRFIDKWSELSLISKELCHEESL